MQLSHFFALRGKLAAICIPLIAALALAAPAAQAAISQNCLNETPASGRYVGQQAGATVWGNNSSGYTTDSHIGMAAVHAGLLQPGAAGQLTITPLGKLPAFFGRTANGVTSQSYSEWCGMKLELNLPKPEISVQYSVAMPLQVEQNFDLRWSTKNATSLQRECTAEKGGFQSALQDMALPSGSLNNSAQASWVGKPSTCVWTASGPGGTYRYTEVRTTKALDVPTPTDPSKPPTLEVSVSPNPIQAGQYFNLRWKASNASQLGLRCTANGDGFKTDVPDMGSLDGSDRVLASEKWVGNPSTCTWTASGPGGSKAVTQTWETSFNGSAPLLDVQYSSPMPLISDKPFTVSWQSSNATRVTRECKATAGGFVQALQDMPSLSGSINTVASTQWVDHPSTCTWTASGPGGVKTVVEVRSTVFPPATPSKPAEEITFFHNDAAGTALLASDATGKIIWRENALPYGMKQQQSKAVGNSVGYTGKPFDDDTGLSYMNARYYDPVLGRFLAMDSVDFIEGNVHSFNRYAYANNNPYRFVDPTGHIAEGVYGMDTGPNFSSGGSTPRTTGMVLGGVVGGMVAGGCSLASAGTCAFANPWIIGGGIVAGAVIGDRIDRAWGQLDRLITKSQSGTSGPTEYQYALVATTTGLYPNVRGGLTTLNAGDVWKYGTTLDPQDRYSTKVLRALSLRMYSQTQGNHYEVLAAEKAALIGHAIAHGELPPGNKIFK